MLTVVNQDNTFSGVQYEIVRKEFIVHHKQYGQKLLWLERRVNTETEKVQVGIDVDGNPVYDDKTVVETATSEDLENEVVDFESWQGEHDPFLNRIRELEEIIDIMLNGGGTP